MVRTVFQACAHTCGHDLSVLSTHARRPTPIRTCPIFDVSKNSLRRHVINPRYHPHCHPQTCIAHPSRASRPDVRAWVGSFDSPSSFKSTDVVKVARGRDPTDKEWAEWFLLIAVFYPKEVEFIPPRWRPTREEIEVGELAVSAALGKGKEKRREKGVPSLQSEERKRKADEVEVEWVVRRPRMDVETEEEEEESEEEREREARVKRPKLDSHVEEEGEQNGEDEEASCEHRSLWIRIPPASSPRRLSSSPLSSLSYSPSPASTKSTDQTSCFGIDPPPRKYTPVPRPDLFPEIHRLNISLCRQLKVVFVENQHQEPDVHEKKRFFSAVEVGEYVSWLQQCQFGKDYMGTPPVDWEWSLIPLIMGSQRSWFRWEVTTLCWSEYITSVWMGQGDTWELMERADIVIGGVNFAGDFMHASMGTSLTPKNLNKFLTNLGGLYRSTFLWPNPSDLLYGGMTSGSLDDLVALSRAAGTKYPEILTEIDPDEVERGVGGVVVKRNFSEGTRHVFTSTRGVEQMVRETEEVYGTREEVGWEGVVVRPRWYATRVVEGLVLLHEVCAFLVGGRLVYSVMMGEGGPRVIEEEEGGFVRFVEETVKRLVELEERKNRRKSGLRVFCRLDVGVFEDVEKEKEGWEVCYIVNKVTRSHGCELFMRCSAGKTESLVEGLVNILGAMAQARGEKQRVWSQLS